MGSAPADENRHRSAFAAAAGAVVAIDQLTKHWALQVLDDGPIDIIGSLRLKLTFNDGAAFSLGSGQTTTISLLGLAVAAFILVLGLRAGRRSTAVAYGVLMGGALGNLTDRALRSGDGFLGGRVVDFIDLQWWPVFNIADAALWLGIALLVIGARRDPDSA